MTANTNKIIITTISLKPPKLWWPRVAIRKFPHFYNFRNDHLTSIVVLYLIEKKGKKRKIKLDLNLKL